MKYGHLEFGIPSDDLMTLHVDSGLAEGTCSNIHDDTHTFRPMFGFHFNNANGLGTATYNPHKEAVAMKISEWHLDQTSIVLDYPPIFLPEEFITDTLKHVVNVTTEAANAFLYDHPYVLPQGFQAKAPNPNVHLRHQDGCCNNIHGFVEITSTVPAGCIMCPQAALTGTIPVVQSPPPSPADALSAPSARLDTQTASDTGGSVWATLFEHPSDTIKGCHMQDVGSVGTSHQRSRLMYCTLNLSLPALTRGRVAYIHVRHMCTAVSQGPWSRCRRLPARVHRCLSSCRMPCLAAT